MTKICYPKRANILFVMRFFAYRYENYYKYDKGELLSFKKLEEKV